MINTQYIYRVIPGHILLFNLFLYYDPNNPKEALNHCFPVSTSYLNDYDGE